MSDTRKDGLHCVYGECQAIRNGIVRLCHPGCSFQMSAISNLELLQRRPIASPDSNDAKDKIWMGGRIREQWAEIERLRSSLASPPDADLILNILRAERDRIARNIDNCVLAWKCSEEYSWFNRSEHLANERVKLASANAAIARRL